MNHQSPTPEPSRRRSKRKPNAIERKADDLERAEPALKCAVLGCRRPVASATRQGLSQLHCEYHRQLLKRHGSPRYPSYRATHLRPYLRAALGILRARQVDPFVMVATQAIASALATARPIPVYNLPYVRSSAQKADAALARLAVAGVPPVRILARSLAVLGAIREDPFAPRTPEFRAVQVAKFVGRLASGHHLRYANGVEFHRYARSSGRFLRVLGDRLVHFSELVDDRYGGDVLAAKVAAVGPYRPNEPPSIPRSRYGDERVRPVVPPQDPQASRQVRPEEAPLTTPEELDALIKQHGLRALKF